MTNCLCCGKAVDVRDGFALHTKCMRNHAAHLEGERSSRCRTGVKRTTIRYDKLPEDWTGLSLIEMATVPFEEWKREGIRVKREGGIDRAGLAGASCPRCYRQVRQFDRATYESEWCHCEDQLAPWAETMTAHGFPADHPVGYRSDFTAV